MTGEKAKCKEFKKQILSRSAWHPFPKYEEREAWAALPAYYREHYLSEENGKTLLDFELKPLLATHYMVLYRTGLRACGYEEAAAKRRHALVNAVLTECMEGKGRFVDKIIDLVWAICEESAWIAPAHNNHMHDHMLSGVNENALPDVTDYNFVDLHSSVTGCVLAMTYYFLKDRLDEESPLICKRIELELMKRVFIPFKNHDDMTWNGFYGHKINNWNPWILSNIMVMTMACCKDEDFRTELMGRAMKKLDIYIHVCPPDGGCDEGPGYWYAAGASLYDCLEILYDASAGALNFFTEPLVKNIGEYAVKSHLKNGSFANFGDNGVKVGGNPLLLYRFGKHVNSESMQQFAAFRFQPEKEPWPLGGTNFYRDLKGVFGYDELKNATKAEFKPISDLLPDTQHFYVHSKDDVVQFACKGGFNNESHNHNDLGSFILAREGWPVMVDLGCLPYQDKTFSPQRYEIWILTAAWHNCVQVNGYEQHDGDQYTAKILSASIEEDKAVFEVDLAGAYEVEANIASYIRKMTFCRTCGNLTVEDAITLKAPGTVTRHFVSAAAPVLTEGAARYGAGDADLVLKFDAAATDAAIVEHDLESDGQKETWNEEVCRRLDLTEKELRCDFDLTAELVWEVK